MRKLVKIIHNPVLAQLIDPEREVRLMVSEILSYKVAGAEYRAAGQHGWDGTSSMFEMRKNRFPAGFVRLVKKRLERSGYRVLVHSKPAPDPRGPENPKVDDFPDDPRYEYQPETVRRLISLKGMVAQIATGGGKSKIFKLAAERLGLPTLFITTRKSLMYQMAENYAQTIGKPVGILGDGQWKPVFDGVNFAIVDTLVSRIQSTTVKRELEKLVDRELERREELVEKALKKAKLPTDTSMFKEIPEELRLKLAAVRREVDAKHPIDEKSLAAMAEARAKKQNKKRAETLELLEKIGFLCLEEAHEVSGNGFYDLTAHCKNAHYRLALTATPFMKDAEEANMRLMAATGPIGIRVSEKLLIDRGILATPYFRFAAVQKPPKLFKSTPWSRAYEIGITSNVARNREIVRECVRAKQNGLTAMVLVQYAKHGKTLEKMLSAVGVRCRFIFGAHEQKHRAKALGELGRGELDVLIGSTILDVGVDVPAVGLVVLAGAGKAEVSIRQRIGRGLRAKKSGPNVAFILDFTDDGNNHLRKHARERRRIIDDTPGFAENVVERFNYEEFGFNRRSA